MTSDPWYSDRMVPSPNQGQPGPAARPRAGALRQAEAWVFDLDNTLYPPSTNLFAQIDERMRSFIARFLDLDLDEARRVQKSYFREYGTTLRGLMNRHGLEPGLFLEYVHAVDLDPVPPNPALGAALARLPRAKVHLHQRVRRPCRAHHRPAWRHPSLRRRLRHRGRRVRAQARTPDLRRAGAMPRAGPGQDRDDRGHRAKPGAGGRRWA